MDQSSVEDIHHTIFCVCACVCVCVCRGGGGGLANTED